MSSSSTTANARLPTNGALEPFLDPVAESAELIAEGRAAEVVARCEALIAAGRGGALMRLALGRGLLALDRTGDALAALREATRGDRAANILRDNHYGWFQRAGRGIYELTTTGHAATATFTMHISALTHGAQSLS